MMAIQQIAPPKPVDPAVEAELDRLPTTPIADLRKRYRELFRTEPPKAFGPDLLRRGPPATDLGGGVWRPPPLGKTPGRPGGGERRGENQRPGRNVPGRLARPTPLPRGRGQEAAAPGG